MYTNYKKTKESNKGSIVVEMCFIMPIVIVVVFVVINMMLTQINKSAAYGEIQAVTYNKESYIESSSSDIASALECVVEANLSETMSFVDCLNAVADIESSSSYKNVFTSKTGYMKLSVSYQEQNIGIFLILDSGTSSGEVSVNEEIRDTGSNLRRWQIYGKNL